MCFIYFLFIWYFLKLFYHFVHDLLSRFYNIYCCLTKTCEENFVDTNDVDKTTVELRYCARTNY